MSSRADLGLLQHGPESLSLGIGSTESRPTGFGGGVMMYWAELGCQGSEQVEIQQPGHDRRAGDQRSDRHRGDGDTQSKAGEAGQG